jgi:hypothetical protein
VTQLYFIFNHYFNNLLLSERNYLTPQEAKEGVEFASVFYHFWQPYNQIVFDKFAKLGLYLPSEWHVYFVYSKGKVVPSSSPLILYIYEDLHDVAATLIHELTHLMLLTDNMRGEHKFQEIWSYLYQEFQGESQQVIEHLIVNVIVKDILIEIFPSSEVDKIIKYEKTLLGAGLARAWSILESQDEKVLASDRNNPLDRLLALKYNPQANYLPEERIF